MSRFQDIIGQALRWWFPGEEILVDYRPDWLFGMEIDFYFPGRSLAIEVQGEQHYRFVQELHGTRMKFREQRERDRRKRRICKERGVNLLVARRHHGLVCCGLRIGLRKLGIRVRHLPDSIKADWKHHNAVLQRLKVGTKRANGEWKQQYQKIKPETPKARITFSGAYCDYCPVCGMLRSQCDCWDPVNQL